MHRTELDEHELLYVWRVESGFTQTEVAAQFECSQNAISKMEVGYEDRQGLPVREDIEVFVNRQKIVFDVPMQVSVMRRRAQLLKEDVALELDVSTYIVGEMEDPHNEREPSQDFIDYVAGLQ